MPPTSRHSCTLPNSELNALAALPHPSVRPPLFSVPGPHPWLLCARLTKDAITHDSLHLNGVCKSAEQCCVNHYYIRDGIFGFFFPLLDSVPKQKWAQHHLLLGRRSSTARWWDKYFIFDMILNTKAYCNSSHFLNFNWEEKSHVWMPHRPHRLL